MIKKARISGKATALFEQSALPKRTRPRTTPIVRDTKQLCVSEIRRWSAFNELSHFMPAVESQDTNKQIGRKPVSPNRLTAAAQAVQWRPIPGPRCVERHEGGPRTKHVGIFQSPKQTR
jgi:hypothetical protein